MHTRLHAQGYVGDANGMMYRLTKTKTGGKTKINEEEKDANSDSDSDSGLFHLSWQCVVPDSPPCANGERIHTRHTKHTQTEREGER
jgi:hypothetical protein